MEVSTNPAVTREVAEQAVAASPDRTEQWARATASGVFLLAAAYTFYAARGMSRGMRMPGGWTMPMMWMAMPGQSLVGAGFVFLSVDVAGDDDRHDASVVVADVGTL